MYEDGYLIPANTKKSLLILNMMRWIDLIIALSGIAITVFLLLILDSSKIGILLLAITPALICLGLIIPIPNYHNTLVAIQSILRFYNGRRNYIWKGWCIYDEFKDNK